MLEGKSLGVVIPCYNEQTQIGKVLATMPDFVDCAIVVDDTSRDDTVNVVEQYIAEHPDQPVVLCRHKVNGGVGKALLTGYREAICRKLDVVAVMAGDGQMDPADLPALAGIVARDEADYVKVNRLFYQKAWHNIPRIRYLGNAFLSMLTKIASGYWHVADSQAGYTVISLDALRTIRLAGMYPRYGYPNDLLVRLNVYDMRVADVSTRPVYNVGEQSKMKIHKVIPRMSWLIFRRFLWRLKEKYLIRDFHPLVLFYSLGSLSLIAGLALGLYLLIWRIFVGTVAGTSGLFAALLFITGLQLTLFAMWFDMEANRHLRVYITRARLARPHPDTDDAQD